MNLVLLAMLPILLQPHSKRHARMDSLPPILHRPSSPLGSLEPPIRTRPLPFAQQTLTHKNSGSKNHDGNGDDPKEGI
jgi:hypothetical protein